MHEVPACQEDLAITLRFEYQEPRVYRVEDLSYRNGVFVFPFSCVNPDGTTSREDITVETFNIYGELESHSGCQVQIAAICPEKERKR